MSLLTKAAVLLAASASFTTVFAAPTNVNLIPGGVNTGGFKTHVSATSNHIPGHGTHFQLPDHLKLARDTANTNSIPGNPDISDTEKPQDPQSKVETNNLYTNHTFVPTQAYNNSSPASDAASSDGTAPDSIPGVGTRATKRDAQALSGPDSGEEKKHIPMPHRSSFPFVDQATGISFQRFYDETTQFSFALALSGLSSASSSTGSLLGSSAEEAKNDATDFIAQISFPLNATTGLGRGAGWGGISISPKLTASHLPLFLGIQTDGFGNLAFSSFTETVASGAGAGHGEQEKATTPGQQAAESGKDLAFKIRTIESATHINSTLLTYTFLCEGCLSISKCAANLESYKAAGKTKVLRLGWATGDTVASGYANQTEADAAPSNERKFAYHRLGFGHLKIDLEGALHSVEEFAEWRGLAMEEVRGFEGVAPPFAMDLVNGVAESHPGKEVSEGGETDKEEGEKGVEEGKSESESDSDSDSDCGCESDSDSDSDSGSDGEEEEQGW